MKYVNLQIYSDSKHYHRYYVTYTNKNRLHNIIYYGDKIIEENYYIKIVNSCYYVDEYKENVYYENDYSYEPPNNSTYTTQTKKTDYYISITLMDEIFKL